MFECVIKMSECVIECKKTTYPGGCRASFAQRFLVIPDA